MNNDNSKIAGTCDQCGITMKNKYILELSEDDALGIKIKNKPLCDSCIRDKKITNIVRD